MNIWTARPSVIPTNKRDRYRGFFPIRNSIKSVSTYRSRLSRPVLNSLLHFSRTHSFHIGACFLKGPAAFIFRFAPVMRGWASPLLWWSDRARICWQWKGKYPWWIYCGLLDTPPPRWSHWDCTQHFYSGWALTRTGRSSLAALWRGSSLRSGLLHFRAVAYKTMHSQ